MRGGCGEQLEKHKRHALGLQVRGHLDASRRDSGDNQGYSGTGPKERIRFGLLSEPALDTECLPESASKLGHGAPISQPHRDRPAFSLGHATETAFPPWRRV